MAHESAGPKTDIVLSGMGFIAKSAEECSLILQNILVKQTQLTVKKSTLTKITLTQYYPITVNLDTVNPNTVNPTQFVAHSPN